jgi:hypothetical protein
MHYNKHCTTHHWYFIDYHKLKGQLSGIVLFIIIFLAIDKPSKEWIIVPSINKVMFAMYVVMRNLSLLFVFKKYSWITLMIYVLHVPIAPHILQMQKDINLLVYTFQLWKLLKIWDNKYFCYYIIKIFMLLYEEFIHVWTSSKIHVF